MRLEHMADRLFEREVDRQFAMAPAFADADLFTLRVTARLDRGWTFRRFLIGGLGMVGGAIGGAQILQSGLAARVRALGSESNALINTRLEHLTDMHVLPASLGVGSEVLLTCAALAVLAVGFAVTRAIREI